MIDVDVAENDVRQRVIGQDAVVHNGGQLAAGDADNENESRDDDVLMEQQDQQQ